MTIAPEWMPFPGELRFRPPAWVGDLVAALLIVATAVVPFPGSEFRPGSPLVGALVIASAGILPLRRRWPLPVLAIVLALYGATAMAGTLSPGVAIAAAVAMFGVANRTTRRITFITAGVALTAVVLLSQPAQSGALVDPPVIQFAFMVAFAAAAGDASRSRSEYMAAVTERAERAEQTREVEARRRVAEERLRIARDLHDAVAHQISVISLNAGVASSALETRPEKAREALGAIRSASRTVLGEIGNLLAVLRTEDSQADTTLPQPGLDRLESLLAGFSDVGLQVSTRIEGELEHADGAAGLVAYRVIQEALTNAHKHGAGQRAHLLLSIGRTEARIVVTNPVPAQSSQSSQVSEPGQSSEGRPASRGHGLLGVNERVASVKGTVSAGPCPEGWRVSAALPLAHQEAS